MMISRKKRKKRFEWFGHNIPFFDISLWCFLTLVGGVLPNADAVEDPGTVTTTSYPSGIECGSSTRWRCLSHTPCSNEGICQCPAQTKGNGNFQCYPINSSRAEISGSPPVMKSFYNSNATILMPCRYRLTGFTTVLNNRKQDCTFQMFATNQIVGGKLLLSGFEVHLQVRQKGKIVGEIGIRKEGRIQNNVYTYTERGKSVFRNETPVTGTAGVYGNDFLNDGSGSGNEFYGDQEVVDENEWGPPEEIILPNGERIGCSIDHDNFAIVSTTTCGAYIRFRAASVDGTRQDDISGLSVTISDEIDHVHFQSPETYLAETDIDGQLRKNAAQKGISIEEEILHQVMEYGAKQYSTPEGTECEDTATTYTSFCWKLTNKIQALKSCSFLLKERLVACMDSSGGSASTNSLNAFKLCLWHTCQSSQNVCSLLQTRLQDKGCLSLTPDSFVARNCNV